MIEFLYSIDVVVFFFINHTLSNRVFDWLMPFITDLNRNKVALSLVGVFLIYVFWRGGKTGRVTIGVLIFTIVLSDQLNSTYIKEIFGRIRPCRVLDGVRMLVNCGGGLSFPSSHAVNNFAGAAVISHFYPKQKWYWFSYAFLVALSRPYVGVHYPSDIIAGGIFGLGIGFVTINIWEFIDKKIKELKLHN